MANLFADTVPALLDNADGTTNYALGTRFTPSVAGTATHGRWRFPTTTPSAVTQVSIGVYRVSDQQLLGSAQFPLLTTPGGWREVAFGTPIALVAGVEYAVVVWTPLRYTATTNYSWPFSSGPLTASSDNGWLTANPGGLVYPTVESGNNAAFFADVVFAADPSVVTLTPTTISLAPIPLAATPGPVTATLTPALIALTGAALSATPGPVTITLTPATITVEAVPPAAPLALPGALTASGTTPTLTTTATTPTLTAGGSDGL